MSETDFEILDERFRRCVLPNAPLETLAEGFRWLEGPVWFADQQCLLFSDIPNDRVMRWTEDGGVSVFRHPAGFANGHTRDREGRLVTCSHALRQVSRTELDGTETVLATHFEGKRLNSPNDLVVASDGAVWFTDPVFGITTDYEGGRQESELPPAVYRLDPHDGEPVCAIADLAGPNGLCFSPDERTLYLVDTGEAFAARPGQTIYAAAVGDGGRLGERRVFHVVASGFPDGLRCDEDGRLWVATTDGVLAIAPDGTLLGRIRVPSSVSNIAFGGRSRSRLFLCASQTLFAIYLNVRGAARP